MTGKDEQQMVENVKKGSKRNNGVDTNLSEQLKSIIVSVNGDDRRTTCNYFAENMLSSDTRHIREMYKRINPDVKLKFDNKNNFNRKIDELNQETETLIDEIEKWQT